MKISERPVRAERAFASVVCAIARRSTFARQINVNGGAIAMGHPLARQVPVPRHGSGTNWSGATSTPRWSRCASAPEGTATIIELV